MATRSRKRTSASAVNRRDAIDRNKIRAGAKALGKLLEEHLDVDVDGLENGVLNMLAREVVATVAMTASAPEEGGGRQTRRDSKKRELTERRHAVLEREKAVEEREAAIDPTQTTAMAQIKTLCDKIGTKEVFALDSGVLSEMDARAAAAFLRCGITEQDLLDWFPRNYFHKHQDEVLRRRRQPPVGFPEPAVGYLSCGPLWCKNQIVAWLDERSPSDEALELPQLVS